MGTRRERVVLDLQDGLSPGLIRAATAAKLLDRELNSLSGTSVQTSRASANISRDIDGVTRSARDADGSINQLTGRLRVLGEVFAILGPATVPIGAVAVPAVTGLAAQLGFAAVAGGVLMGSMRGLGDAISAMNKADLEPTAENLAKAEDALNALAPAARDFAKELRELGPHLKAIRDIGAESLAPGLTASLDDLERLGPKVAAIFDSVGGALGSIASDSAASLASERWGGFFAFIAEEAPEALLDLSATIGSITHGMAEMWQAFDPLNDDFSGWLRDAAADFDRWAQGLSQTEGFAEFVDYIRTNGPQVADTLAAVGDAVLQIVEASAPLGGPVLAALEASAKAVSAIADSDLGTPILAGVAALSLLNRSLAVTAALSKTSLSTGLFAGLGTASTGLKKGAGSIRADVAAMSSSLVAFGHDADKAGAAASRMKGRLAGIGKAGAGLGALALMSSDATKGMEGVNTASLALMGGALGGPLGIAIGGGAGALMDMAAANDAVTASINAGNLEQARADYDALSDQVKTSASDIGLLGLAATGPAGLASQLVMSGDKAKNWVEGIFGKSDLEEAAAGVDKLAAAEKKAAAAEDAREEIAKDAAITYARSVGVNMDAGKSALYTTKQIERQAEAMVKARKAAREQAAGFVNLTDSVDDSKVSLGEWIRQMGEQADALRNFRLNAKKAASEGLDKGLIESLQEAGTAGALRMKQLANATDTEIDRANRAWRRGRAEMQRYEDFKVGAKKIDVNTDPAMASLASLVRSLRGIKDETVMVNVIRRGQRSGVNPLNPYDTSADGSTVPKTGLPYADRHPYLLADGEEVISNRRGQADRHRPLLKAINAGRLADGGTAGKKSSGELRDPHFEARAEARAEREHQARMDFLSGQERATSEWLDVAKVQEDTAKQTRDDLAATMASIGSGATAGFQSDLFATTPGDSNIWASGAKGPGGGWMDNLTGDIAGLEERRRLIEQLSAAGLDGDALGDALEQGSNEDLQSLLSSGQVQAFEDMFNQRAALTASVSMQAGQAAFGAEFAAANAQVAQYVAEVGKLQTMVVDLQRMQSPESPAAQRGYAVQGEMLAGAVKSGVVNGFQQVARRG